MSFRLSELQFQIYFIVSMLILLISVSLLHSCVHSLNTVPTVAVAELVSLYRSDGALNKIADDLAKNYSQISQVRTCKQDQSYRYLHMGDKKISTAVIICNIHPRQLITGQICIEWAQNYLKRNDVDDIGIDLFYIANKNRQKVITTLECERKSVDGFDLNRNFPVQFNYYNASSEEGIYSGPRPVNDPFVKCLWQILHKNETLLFVDIHSGQNGGLFYQQGYNSIQDRQIFEKINQQVCNHTCRITTLAQDGQAINGHIFASSKVLLDMKYSLLIESYGNHQPQCLLMFNPLTLQQKKKIEQKWVKGLNLIIDEVKRREDL